MMIEGGEHAEEEEDDDDDDDDDDENLCGMWDKVFGMTMGIVTAMKLLPWWCF